MRAPVCVWRETRVRWCTVATYHAHDVGDAATAPAADETEMDYCDMAEALGEFGVAALSGRIR